MPNFIYLDTEGRDTFNQLKIESGFDFSKLDVDANPYYSDWIIPEFLLTDPRFAEFKQWLQDGGHLDNITTQEIPDEGPGSLAEYWESVGA